jgi:hypothetical protein
VERYARLDVITCNADAAVSNSLVHRNPSGRREHTGNAVVADAVRVSASDRVGDLSTHHSDNEIPLVHAW